MTKTNFFNHFEPKLQMGVLPEYNQVLAEVVYGLASRDCKGMGICKIKIVTSLDYHEEQKPCGSSLALIRNLDGEHLRFDFLRHTINIQQYTLRFASGFFQMEEPFGYPNDLLVALGSSASEISKGRYPIIYSELFVSVEFSPC